MAADNVDHIAIRPGLWEEMRCQKLGGEMNNDSCDLDL